MNDYANYRKITIEAARELRGRVESLAGGYYGVRLPVEGCVYVALDLDGYLDGDTGWWAWREDADGMCCDDGAIHLGDEPYATLQPKALEAVIKHRMEAHR